MEYENRPVPENNLSTEHPLKEFFTLLAGLTVIVVLAVAALATLAQTLARQIPFRFEEQLLADGSFFSDQKLTPAEQRIEQYLRELGGGLAANMDLPPDMPLNIHYSSDDTVNAFAFLGGHIVIFKGLIDHMPHENSLAMVLAHEIAHIKRRHPIVAAGRGITVTVALAAMTGIGDSAVADLVSLIGVPLTLGFSRAQEEAADKDALAALQAYYGHVLGAEALFYVLEEHSFTEPPVFLSTHPATDARIQQITARQGEDTGKDTTPLPNFLKLKSTDQD